MHSKNRAMGIHYSLTYAFTGSLPLTHFHNYSFFDTHTDLLYFNRLIRQKTENDDISA